MSNEITTSQSYASPSFERQPAPEIKIQADPAPSPVLADHTMRSFTELKRAESNGEIVPISDEQLVKAIQRAIKAAEGITTSLEFSVHKATNQISVKVLDKETGEIIREIPPEKNLDFLASLWRKAGILIDEKR